MHPPPSPTRTNHAHAARGAPSTASAASSVSAALQGATLAFDNKRREAAAVAAAGSSNSNGRDSNSVVGRGPSPGRHQQQSHGAGAPHTTTGLGGSGVGVKKSGLGTTSTGLPSGASGSSNGALLAATQAARGHAAASRSAKATEEGGGGGGSMGVNRDGTGGSRSGSGAGKSTAPGVVHSSGLPEGGHIHGSMVALRLAELHHGGASTLLSPPGGGRPGAEGGKQAGSSSPSPSLIAATLAASRSASPVRGVIPQLDLNGGRVARARGQSVGSASLMAGAAGLGKATSGADVPDTASIPPTTSLVSLFEGKRADEDVDPVKKRVPSVRGRDPDADGQAQMERQQPQRQKTKPQPKPKPKAKPKPCSRPAPFDGAHNSSETMAQTGHAPRGDDKDETVRSDAKSPLEHQTKGQVNEQATRDSKSQVKKRTPTPPSSAPTARSPKQKIHRPGMPSKPQRRPTPPARISSAAKMTEPTVDVAPVELDEQMEEPYGLQQQETKLRRLSDSSSSSHDTFVSASSVQSRPVSPIMEADRRPSRPSHLRQGSSIRSISTPDLQRPLGPRASTPNITLNALTNAIVASNLASTRLTPTTPAQRPTVPPPRRSGRNPSSHSPLQPQRTAESIRSQLTGGSKSPNRQTQQKTGMLQTLRSPHNPSLSDDEDARRRLHHHRRRNKVLGRGNRKHAHHEGSRRRWRDEITARERRRYEAVWASNRGLFLRPGCVFQHPPPPPTADSESNPTGQNEGDWEPQLVASRALPPAPEADLVVNIVVRDIWSRSRLPADELAEVWDLVDRQQRGALGRDEFVVGMWLIDQRLRGRKIPARVSQSVWESAGRAGGGAGGGGVQGVVVRLPGEGKGRKKGRKGR